MQNDNKLKTVFIEDSDDKEDVINIREEFEKYSFYWKWFIAGFLIALVVAFLYLRYATYQYEVSSTILIDDEEKGIYPPNFRLLKIWDYFPVLKPH